MKTLKGFTLIEILLAITIIAVIASLAMPAFRAATESSKKAEAAAVISTLKMALTQYRAEYGDWPQAIQSFTNSAGDIILGFDAGENQWGELYRCLAGNNPRKLMFGEFQQKIFSSSTGEPFIGNETNSDNVKNLIDPWNRPYKLVLDHNGDYKVNVPNLQNPTPEMIDVVTTIAIWSTAANSDLPTKYIGTWK